MNTIQIFAMLLFIGASAWIGALDRKQKGLKKGSDRPYHSPSVAPQKNNTFPIKILKEIPNDYVN